MLALGQRRKVLERVGTLVVRLHGLDLVAEDIDNGLTVGANQLEAHAGNARLALVLDAIAVHVEPDLVAHRHALLHEAEVEGRVLVAILGQVTGLGLVGRRVLLRVVALAGLGRLEALGNTRHLHRVVLALGQRRKVLERVGTLVVRLHGLDGVTEDIGHLLAVGADQLEAHAGKTRLILVLDAVTVAVFPDLVAHTHLRQVEAEVKRVVAVAVLRQLACGCRVGRRVLSGIRVFVLDRRQVTLGSGHRDDVLLALRQNRKVVERVCAVFVGRGRRDLVTEDVNDLLTIGARDRQRHVADTRLILALDAVAVFVVPDEVTHGNRGGHETEVEGVITVAVLRQLACGCRVGRRVLSGIRVFVLDRRQVTLWSGHRHDVRHALRQNREVAERVLAVFVGRGRGDLVTEDVDDLLVVAAGNRQRHVTDARLVVVLDAVAVAVEPDVVTHGDRRRTVTGVDRRVVGLCRLGRVAGLASLVGGSREGELTGLGVGVRVVFCRLVVALRGERPGVAVLLDRGREDDGVFGTGDQVGEGVVTVFIRRGLGLDTVGVAQRDRHATCRGLVLALLAVAVRVEPDVVTHRHDRHEAEVEGEVLGAILGEVGFRACRPRRRVDVVLGTGVVEGRLHAGGGLRHLHGVRLTIFQNRKVREEVLTVFVRGDRGNLVAEDVGHRGLAVGAVERQLNAGQRLVGVATLNAVTVVVEPYVVAHRDSRQRNKAEVDRVVVLVRCGRGDLGDDVAVYLALRTVAVVRRRRAIGFRRGRSVAAQRAVLRCEVVGDNHDVVVLVRLEAVLGAEVVRTVLAGGRRRDDGVTVAELECDALDALFVRILNAVAVLVDPDVVTDLLGCGSNQNLDIGETGVLVEGAGHLDVALGDVVLHERTVGAVPDTETELAVVLGIHLITEKHVVLGDVGDTRVRGLPVHTGSAVGRAVDVLRALRPVDRVAIEEHLNGVTRRDVISRFVVAVVVLAVVRRRAVLVRTAVAEREDHAAVREHLKVGEDRLREGNLSRRAASVAAVVHAVADSGFFVTGRVSDVVVPGAPGRKRTRGVRKLVGNDVVHVDLAPVLVTRERVAIATPVNGVTRLVVARIALRHELREGQLTRLLVAGEVEEVDHVGRTVGRTNIHATLVLFKREGGPHVGGRTVCRDTGVGPVHLRLGEGTVLRVAVVLLREVVGDEGVGREVDRRQPMTVLGHVEVTERLAAHCGAEGEVLILAEVFGVLRGTRVRNNSPETVVALVQVVAVDTTGAAITVVRAALRVGAEVGLAVVVVDAHAIDVSEARSLGHLLNATLEGYRKGVNHRVRLVGVTLHNLSVLDRRDDDAVLNAQEARVDIADVDRRVVAGQCHERHRRAERARVIGRRIDRRFGELCLVLEAANDLHAVRTRTQALEAHGPIGVGVALVDEAVGVVDLDRGVLQPLVNRVEVADTVQVPVVRHGDGQRAVAIRSERGCRRREHGDGYRTCRRSCNEFSHCIPLMVCEPASAHAKAG